MKVNKIYEWVCPYCGFIHRSKIKPGSCFICKHCNNGEPRIWKKESSGGEQAFAFLM